MSGDTEDRGFLIVTGTSTGIGNATALHLAGNGFHVFAGVWSAKEGEALRAQEPERLTPVIIDVTKESTITAARGHNRSCLPWGIAAWPASSTTQVSPSARP